MKLSYNGNYGLSARYVYCGLIDNLVWMSDCICANLAYCNVLAGDNT